MTTKAQELANFFSITAKLLERVPDEKAQRFVDATFEEAYGPGVTAEQAVVLNNLLSALVGLGDL